MKYHGRRRVGGVGGHSGAANNSSLSIIWIFFFFWKHFTAFLNGLWQENKYDRCVE